MKGICNISGNKEEIIAGKISQGIRNYSGARKQGYCTIPKLTGISKCKITFNSSMYATISLNQTWGTQLTNGQILDLPCTVWWIHGTSGYEGDISFELIPDKK